MTVCEIGNHKCATRPRLFSFFWHLGQRGQQSLRVIQGGPAIRQTVGHVPQLLPDRRKADLDVAQAGPGELVPAFQIAEHRQSLTVQLLEEKSTGFIIQIW